MKPVLLLHCLLIALAGGCANHVRTVKPGAVYRSSIDTTTLTLGNWTFFWGTDGNLGYPLEAFLRLYASNDCKVVNLQRPEALSRLSGIRIGSGEAALAAVRLFTATNSFLRFDTPRAVEVPEGPLRISNTSDGFLITRSLVYVSGNGNSFQVYEVGERLSFNGDYLCKRGRLLEVFHQRPAWIPGYE